ncbi:MAG: hypothetical protein AUG80_20955 [Candidatus Rokubacteria bacterium 13_1_20CM_4_68_9]|nr:MAG: hypothetical protein AUG80_20955 [Candidatus Rokubacteria bacterium 13_1_20CM_4_68_9]
MIVVGGPDMAPHTPQRSGASSTGSTRAPSALTVSPATTMCQLPGSTSASATASAAAPMATSQSVRRRSCTATRARNTAGNAKSRPYRSGRSTRPPSAVPTATPPTNAPEMAAALPR